MALPNLAKLSPTSWIPKLIGLGVVLLLLAVGAAAIYYVAYNKGTNVSKVEVEKFQKEVAELNARQIEREAKVSERVIERYYNTRVERQPIIYRNQEIIRTIVPEGNRVSRGLVHAHDQSAKGGPIDPEKAADTKPSDTTERGLLGVVNENYDLSRANSDRYNALIDWHEQIKKEQKPDEASK